MSRPSEGRPPRQRREEPRLRFAPLAWLKLQYFCHAGETEIGGFAVTAADDPLYVERFETVLQGTTAVSVEFSDDAVADFFDRCVDAGLVPQRFARVWCHTHPGESPEPSATDEETLLRAFGACDWSVMFILGRTSRTYARLTFGAGPGGSMLIPVLVDWSRWPIDLAQLQQPLAAQVKSWRDEYETNVHARALSPLALRLHERWGDELDVFGADVADADEFAAYFEAMEELHGQAEREVAS
jgi:proteasome lid subunit RPN8/RPN11